MAMARINALNKSCSKLNFVQTSPRSHMSPHRAELGPSERLIWLWLLYLLLKLQMTFQLGLDATKNMYFFEKRFK